MAVREGSYYNNSKKFIKKVCIIKYYNYSGKKEYNSRTYIAEINDADNSNTFKK